MSAEATVIAKCSACGHENSAPARFAGKSGKCVKRKAPVKVPFPAGSNLDAGLDLASMKVASPSGINTSDSNFSWDDVDISVIESALPVEEEDAPVSVPFAYGPPVPPPASIPPPAAPIPQPTPPPPRPATPIASQAAPVQVRPRTTPHRAATPATAPASASEPFYYSVLTFCAHAIWIIGVGGAGLYLLTALGQYSMQSTAHLNNSNLKEPEIASVFPTLAISFVSAVGSMLTSALIFLAIEAARNLRDMWRNEYERLQNANR